MSNLSQAQFTEFTVPVVRTVLYSPARTVLDLIVMYVVKSIDFGRQAPVYCNILQYQSVVKITGLRVTNTSNGRAVRTHVSDNYTARA